MTAPYAHLACCGIRYTPRPGGHCDWTCCEHEHLEPRRHYDEVSAATVNSIAVATGRVNATAMRTPLEDDGACPEHPHEAADNCFIHMLNRNEA